MIDRFDGATLVELLTWRAQMQPERLAYRYLSEHGIEESVTYRELDLQVRALAVRIREQHRPGERALLLFQPGMEYLRAFFGCLYAGVVPVPAYPPRANGNLSRLQAVVADAEATLALTTGAILSTIEQRFSGTPGLAELKWLVAEGRAVSGAEQWQAPALAGDSLAFLQYTSGSTSLPKGVMLSHSNLLHNLGLIERCFGTAPEAKGVVWLPPYHDMGLIGGILQPLFTGYEMSLMAPVDFIQKPLRWLESISKYGATLSGGPNFAYELCLQKITPEQRDLLDLSAWEIAFTGAEPVRAETLERFAAFFAPSGFRKEAFYPCYGLAEGTLFVTGGLKREAPVVTCFSGEALKDNAAVEQSASAEEGDRLLVSSGRLSVVEQTVRIADPVRMTALPEGLVGEIWVKGPSVALGYLNREEQTREVFQAVLADTGEGPYLRTGDLGFVQDGELYVTGRIKDMIIIRGRNYYPQDVEFTVQESHPAVKNSNGAAFSVEVDGEERLVVVQEIERAYRRADLSEVAQAIRAAVSEEQQLLLHAIVLLRPVSIPKTSSGKVQRHLCRERFLDGTLDVVFADGAAGDASGSETAEELAEAKKFREQVMDEKGLISRAKLLAMPIEQRVEAVRRLLRERLVDALRLPEAQVGPEMSLHAFGLDSLVAVEIKQWLEEALGADVSLARLLEGPTLVELAAETAGKITAGEQRSYVKSVSGEVDQFPLSKGQQAMWLMQRLDPQSAAYNIARAAKVTSELNVPALREAVKVLVKLHPLLRASFTLQDGEPVAVLRPEPKITFVMQGAESWNEEQLLDELRREANRPFDVEQEPLLRLYVYKTGPQEHVLLLNVHHLVADFWSLGGLVKSLQHAYMAEAQGMGLSFFGSGADYGDFVNEQQELIGGAKGEKLARYWAAKLSGELPVLNLPTDFPRRAGHSAQGGAVAFALPEGVSEQIRELAKLLGVTVNTALLAAFQVLLYRYTGQEDILVGSPTSGRSHSKYAGVFGYFVNTVVQRADLSGQPAFADFLQQVKGTVVEALEHQDYPFPLLVEKLAPEREASVTPLFQAMFTYQKTQVPGMEAMAGLALGEAGAVLKLGELELVSLPVMQEAVQFDLALTMAESQGRLAGKFEYKSDLFRAETIERMAGHFAKLLGSIAEDASQSVARLPMLTEAEETALAAAGEVLAADVCVHQLFEAQAKKTPERVALQFDGQTMTYAKLDAQANRLARFLQNQGVGAETVVGLCVERSFELVIAMLAVMKAGGAYLPLDPAHPEERLAFVLQESGTQVLVTQSQLLERVLAGDATRICLDLQAEEIAALSAEKPASDVQPHHLLNLIYTSGSTGTPKAVMVEHRNAAATLLASQQALPLGEADVMPWLASVAFDIALWDLFSPLLAGGTSRILPRETMQDVPQLVQELQSCTVFDAVPSVMREVVRTVREQGLSAEQFDAMRLLFIGGEAVLTELVADLSTVFRQAAIHVVYGPTEAALICSQYEAGGNAGVSAGSALIGRALDNALLRVYDATGNLLPSGIPGELYIGGAGVARGYYQRPELTADKFVEIDGVRWYKSGDLVRRLADGNLEFLGRLDQQVKVRGYRIELGEIEAALAAHGAVSQAVAAVQEQNLNAYVVLEKGASAAVHELRGHLQEKLPAYMVPSAILVLDRFPLNANGKVDRKALPVPNGSFFDAKAQYVAPRTPHEELIAGVWAEVLHLGKVGALDSFFQLGGNSLSAMRVVTRLTELFGVEVPLRLLFEAATLSEFARRAQELQGAGRAVYAPIDKASRDGQLPMSFSQQRLWVIDRMQPGNPAYNIAACVSLQGVFDRAAAERSFQEIVDRHEALRTRFGEVDGQPVQVIAEQMKVELPLIDLSDSTDEAVQELVQAEAQHEFDLTTGPLLRLRLLKRAEQEHLLLVNMHHIVSDGWSMGVLIQELAALYEAYTNGLESPLAPLSVQYADYAAWQREWLTGSVQNELLSYWKEKLQGELPLLELQTDRPRPAEQTNRGGVQKFLLTPELNEQLNRLGKQEGTTLYMTLLAAFNALLHRLSGQEDILLGTPVAGRGHRETEGLIGFFVNTLVMRTQLHGKMTFRELLADVRNTALDAFAHSDLPFEVLVQELQPERSRSHSPLFQAMFVMQNAPQQQLKLPGLTLTTEPNETGTAKFDLTLIMEEGADGLYGTLEYNADLFDADRIERMAGQFAVLLESLVEKADQPLYALPLLTDAERRQEIEGWNDTFVSYPRDLTLQELFEHQAAQRAEETAVVFGGETLTYGELNEKANRVAHRLQALGVGPDVLVGITAERSLDMVVGLLGIVKAGGAYLPLDPGYPQERLAELVADSGVRVMLTQEHLQSRLPNGAATVLCLDRDRDDFATERADNPPVTAGPEHLAYVTYTSGSTGKPKGVAIPQRAVARLVKNNDYCAMDAEQVFLQFASITFDAATYEIWGALLNGARLVVFPPHMPSLKELGDVIAEHGVTAIFMTTALFHQLAGQDLTPFRNLRHLLFGGEVVSAARLQQIALNLPQTRIVHVYGPTESTTFASFYPVTDLEAVEHSVPIGKPLKNTTLYVLDEHLQPQPPGVPGELFIGGDGLARGYWQREDLTSERFVEAPFLPGERLYKTGDRVYRRADGSLEFLARIDQQVKIRGFRIELGEVEAALAAHPQVKECTVIAREDEPGDKRLVAYLTARESTLAPHTLREFATGRLPNFMVPSAFVVLDALPLNKNGKVDRSALPAPDFAELGGAGEHVAPRTLHEQLIAGVWAEVLHVGQVGALDNFFQLGGHSLSAMQVVSRLPELFDVEVPLRLLFEAQTLSEFARRVQELQDAGGDVLAPVERASRDGQLPLSFAQQRLWVIDRLQPGNPAYNIATCVSIQGAFDRAAAERSFQEIVDRHEALRTHFAERDGQPVQVIAEQMKVELPLIDLSASTEEAVQELVRAEAQHEFDLTTGPLLRLRLLKRAEQEHLLVVNMHHIVSDGWSMGVLIEEFAALYEAYSNGLASPLAPLAVQYADYAAWQREWLTGGVQTKQLAYWKEQLQGELPVLELQTDRPRPAEQSDRGGVQRFWLPKALNEQLNRLSRQEGTTLYMTLLAAFNTLLHRYSGQEDILLGTPVAGRGRKETEGLIGFFVNTLVMRTKLQGEMTFHELLAVVRRTTLDAFAHGDLPFEILVQEVQPERSRSHSPLFQAMFVLQNAPQEQLELPGLTLTTQPIETGTAKFDLTLIMEEQADGLAGTLEYNADLFDADRIERMAGHFAVLLESIVEKVDQPLYALPLLTEEELRQEIGGWNDTAAFYPRDLSIQELFEQQAAQRTEETAVVFGGETLTYGELNAKANRVAHRLQALGVGPDVLVGITAERSLDMVVGLLGIVKAGGAYLPLDPGYPQERLAELIADSGVRVMLTQEHLQDRLPDGEATVLCLDRDWADFANERAENPQVTAGPEHLAYVTYTSGSTGKPKGVAIPQRAVVRLVKGNNFCRMDEEQVFLQFASITFDAATYEIWGALLNGARLAVFPPQVPSLKELGEVIAEHGVTSIFLTAALFHQLAGQDLTPFYSLRDLIVGGDAISAAHLQQIAPHLPHTLITNGYGPTESTTFASFYPVTDLEAVKHSVPIGKPLKNTTLYVLDEHLQPQPQGVPGELYIGGDGLARGYWQREDLTAERFVEAPFLPGERMYKTGDRVYRRADGSLEFLARIDQQVKIRGFRIELGEVEAVLAAHPNVHECTVIAREDEPGDKRLTAYLTARGGALEPAALREYAIGRLPGFMVPSAFVILDALPLNQNGKVDRKALPAPERSSFAAGEAFIAPRTELERIVCRVFADILKLEQVGIHDSFFDLGGHSLLATQAVSALSAELNVQIPLKLLFETGTPAQFAERLPEWQGETAALAPIRPVARDGEMPLSYAQQRLWVIDQLIPDASHYNVAFFLHLHGELHADALQQSFTAIVCRHEALRTTFTKQDGQPVQVINAPYLVELPMFDLLHLPEAERAQEAQRLLTEEAQIPFDLEKGPLLRLRLVKVEATEHMLAVNMHHIVSDGWSIGVMVDELAAHYAALAKGESAELAPLPLQYADYAAWQREWLDGGVLTEQLSYWKQKLSGELPVLQLPFDRPRQAAPSVAGGLHRFELPKALTDALHQLSREQGATLYMTVLSAFKALLYRLSGQEDLLVGTPIAGRNRREIESLIGFFVNTLVLRSDVTGEMAFSDLLRQVKDATLEAYAHQDLPFERLVDELQPERSLSYSPLFQVMFALQNAPLSELVLPGLTLEPGEIDKGNAMFDLSLTLRETEAGLEGTLEYNADLFDAATAARIAGQYEVLLRAISREPALKVGELPLLTEAEREQVLDGFNSRDLDLPPALCMHQLFEQKAAQHPAAEALSFQGATLTYRELNEQANRLAHLLQKQGVAPEQLVGICVERSPWMIIAVLAVQKAGGAYVPIDPAYPKERIEVMLGQCDLAVLLTEEHLLAHLPHVDAHVICLDRAQAALEAEAANNPESAVTPENLAYVIFTSGTTGVPKGVMVQHSTLHYVAHCWQQEYRLDELDVQILQFASMSFDVFAGDLLRAFISGGRLVIVPSDVRLDVPALYQLLEAEKISFFESTPGLVLPLLEHVHKHNLPLSNLKILAVGSDAFAAADYKQVLERFGSSMRILNSYGITETTIDSGYFETTALDFDLQPGSVVPIGRPLPGTCFYILDEHGEPQPVGVPGELYVGGRGVARGYYKRADLTNERFVDNPFRKGERMYKTGDLGAWRADGTLRFIGRADDQVKIRGFRIEIAEIEAALEGVAGLEGAVVTARVDEPGRTYLAAYFIPAEGAAIAVSELRMHLKGKLPDYMVPSAFVQLSELPLTPNGKVDRRALPKPLESDLAAGVEYVAPRTVAEEQIAAIFADVLKREQVGAEDNFFDLGGHSLSAAQVMARLNEGRSLQLPLRTLFELPTVAELARRMETVQASSAAETEHTPIPTLDRAGQLPASYAQQRLWVLDQMLPGSTVYNMPFAVRLHGELQEAALLQSLHAMNERHEALRTTFSEQDGLPLQQIAAHQDFILEKVDLMHLDESVRETETKRLVQEEAGQPFDLANGPLIRVRLVKLSPAEHMLIFNLHHIIFDGWSMGVYIREFGALYEAFSQGKQAELPPLTLQYADYAAWQRGYLQDGVLDRQIGYWKEQLSGELPALQLPTDRPRPKVLTNNGGMEKFALSKELSQHVYATSKRLGVTPFMLLLGAYQAFLSRYSGQEDICVGTPVAGRSRTELEPVIGFFINTLVLRGDLSGNPTFAELVGRVKETALGAYAHQDVPFEKLVEELQPARDLSRSPLFQAMFVMQNTPDPALELSGLRLEIVDLEIERVKYELTLTMLEEEDGLRGVFQFNSDLFDRSTVRRMVTHFVSLLDGALQEPGRTLSELPMLTAAERRTLLQEWNDTQSEFPLDVPLQQLFEAQAAKTPDAPAVAFEGQVLTYRELNEQANRLAHYLRTLGVGPETFVGIFMERTLEMAVGVLGVLKAGGGYVPLDPRFPQDRIRYILEDASAPVLLTLERLQAGLEAGGAQVIALDRFAEEPALHSAANPTPLATTGNIAYVLYTSGSTGKPKGVLIEQRQILNYVFGVMERTNMGAGESYAMLQPLAVDSCKTMLFPPLVSGGCLHVISEERALDAKLLADYFATNRIDWLKIAPSHLAALHQAVEPETIMPQTGLIIGGEGSRYAWVRSLAGLVPSCRVYNHYGPTEATVGVLTYHMSAASDRSLAMTPMGRPLPNTEMYILDAHEQPVPVGVVGELYIGGDSVARGYLNRADLTEERFVPHPFAKSAAARVYRTGDLVRYLPEGDIEFLGRADDQVKIRGFRIELGEIQAVLVQHTAALEALVLPWEARPGDKRLIAYVTQDPQADTQLTVEDLAAFAKEKLPPHMVPQAWWVLPEFPRTRHGKVDRGQLPKPDLSLLTADRDYVAPSTPTEEQVARIWAEVLGAERVGAADNFFEIGGHSLLATQVASRIRQEFAAELPLSALMQSPTVQAVAKLIDEQKSAGAGEGAGSIAAAKRSGGIKTLSRESHRRKRS